MPKPNWPSRPNGAAHLLWSALAEGAIDELYDDVAGLPTSSAVASVVDAKIAANNGSGASAVVRRQLLEDRLAEIVAGEGWTYEGEWDAGTAYTAQQAVAREGAVYVTTAATTGDDPTAGAPWVALPVLVDADARGATFDRRPLSAGSGRRVTLVQGHPDNAVAADVYGATILGGGQDGYNNIIGGDGSATVNTATPNETTTGSGAHYSVVGGYDNVAGGLASIVLGFHNWTGLGTTHGTVLGGSVNRIAGATDYATICGGTSNRVLNGDGSTLVGGMSNEIDIAAGGNGFLGGGNGNRVTGDGATLVGGLNNLASGALAFIGGGSGHVASGTRSVVAGGLNNQATGLRSTVLGGSGNVASSSDTIAGGLSCTASNTSAVALGQSAAASGLVAVALGRDVTASGGYSTALGRDARADTPGQLAHASGRFAVQGDAQGSFFPTRRQTTSAATSQLGVEGGAAFANVAPDQARAFEILVVARDTGAHDSAGWRITGVAHRDAAGAPSVIGTPTVTSLGATSGASSWTVGVGTNSQAVFVNVTGEAGKTINWFGDMHTAEVIG